jgi:hypothetical protein
MARGSSWQQRLAAVGVLVACAAVVLAPPADALNIGIQSAGDGVVRTYRYLKCMALSYYARVY